LRRRKARDTIFWLGVDPGLAQRIVETELKKKTEFFYYIIFFHWQRKESYEFEKRIHKNKQCVAEELGRMIVRKKKQKKQKIKKGIDKKTRVVRADTRFYVNLTSSGRSAANGVHAVFHTHIQFFQIFFLRSLLNLFL
jgi:hypothetical protein